MLRFGPLPRDCGLIAQGVVFDPLSAGLAIGSAVLTGASALTSASGTIAAGEATQYASLMKARTALEGSELVADAQQKGGELQADFYEKSGELAAQAQETGSGLVSKAQREGGRLADEAAEFQAGQADRQARTVRALAQRSAEERRRDTKAALATLRARAASSGGGATDQTILALEGDIAKRGEYLALSDMFAGEEQARGFEDVAKGLRFTGKAQRYGTGLQADATEFAGRSGAETSRWTSKSMADITRWKSTSEALATRVGGFRSAEASMFAGDAAMDAAETSALGTILGGAGSIFKSFSGMGLGSGGGNAFLPSGAFLRNEWGW